MKKVILFKSLLALILVGIMTSVCANGTSVAESTLEQKWLPFLQDGRTTKKEVLLELGIPTEQFEGERILAYTLLFDESKGFAPARDRLTWRSPSWVPMSLYDLMLVFDERDVLMRHGLVLRWGR
jgi:hypothetical protein